MDEAFFRLYPSHIHHTSLDYRIPLQISSSNPYLFPTFPCPLKNENYTLKMDCTFKQNELSVCSMRSKRWNILFLVRKQFVSLIETVCFSLRNVSLRRGR